MELNNAVVLNFHNALGSFASHLVFIVLMLIVGTFSVLVLRTRSVFGPALVTFKIITAGFALCSFIGIPFGILLINSVSKELSSEG